MQLSQTLNPEKRVSALLSNARFQAVSLAIVFCLAYAGTFKELWTYWIEGYNWQFVVPVAFVYMLWDRKDLYSGLNRDPGIILGAFFLAMSCALLVVGEISSTHSLREISIVASIFSLVLLLFGASYVRSLFWPLLYLVLMTSLTLDLLETLRYPLKLISATVAADMLQFSGYAVFREGTFLQLPFITLEVADSCSGLNQLISAIALGIPIAFTFVNLWWKRVFIILLSCVLGLIMNWVRVYLISLWHYNSAKEALHGPYGIYELPFIFLIGVFLTLIVAVAIADKRLVHEPHAVSDNQRDSGTSRKSSTAFLAGFFILAVTALYLNTWVAEPVSLKEGFSGFPQTINSQQGKAISKLDPPFYSGIADEELILEFSEPSALEARVYIGYFHAQDQEKELVDYRYNWLHEGASTINLPVDDSTVQIKTNYVKTRAGRQKVFFWYDINGRVITNPIVVKLASLADALWGRRTNGAIVIVQIEESAAEPTEGMPDFVSQLMSISREYIRENETIGNRPE